MRFQQIVLTSLMLSTSVYAQNWSQLTDFPGGPRDDGTVFTIGNYAYCGTGFKTTTGCSVDFYSFDLSANTWSTVAAMPTGKERQYASGFAYNGEGFVFGGIDGSGNALNDLWKYLPSSNTWTAMPSRPGSGIYGAACFVVNGKAYFIGGSNSSTSASDEVWEYDIGSSTWTQKNNLPFNGSFRGSGCTMNAKGYLLFGRDLNGAHRRHIYEYDASSDTWTFITSFPGTGRIYAAFQPVNNELVMFAGVDSLNNHYKDIWTYDLTSSQWTQKTSLPSFNRKGGMSFATSTAFYYTCGIDQINNRTKETWKIDLFVGIEEQAQGDGQLIAYPNPVKGLICFKGVVNGTFNIINSFGDIIKQGEIIGNKISIQDISEGIYQLFVSEGGRFFATKIVVID